MKKKYIESFKKVLFNKKTKVLMLKTYAVVEKTRHPKAFEEVHFSTLNYINLWDKKLGKEREESPLYLVELRENHNLVEYLLALHHSALATYFYSTLDLEEFYDYYHSFTRPSVEREEGVFQDAVFGCFDPKVLPEYMQTLYSKEKIDEFFYGITVCFSPDFEKNEMVNISYRDKEGSVEQITLNLNTKDNLNLNYENMMSSEFNLSSSQEQRIIDHKQVKIFQEFSNQKFLKELFVAYEEDEGLRLDNTRYLSMASKLFIEAKEVHGMSMEATIYRYILLGILLQQPLSSFSFYEHFLHLPSEKEKVEQLDKLIEYIQEKELVDE
jgi:hypothetical protein